MVQDKKRAIVVGASSGIGRALAKVFAVHGYVLGLVARRIELLQQLQKELTTPTYIKQIDISQPEQAMGLLQQLINEMGGLDTIVINSGINTHNVDLVWEGEINTIAVNVSGFAAMVNVALQHFSRQKSGHIVGISSIACLRGSGSCAVYNASKAFVSNYLEGLRYRLKTSNIYVTDIRPGLVDTAMVRGQPHLFWVATPQGAAEQIFRAIEKKKKLAYVTRRWNLIAWLIRLLPERLIGLRYK